MWVIRGKIQVKSEKKKDLSKSNLTFSWITKKVKRFKVKITSNLTPTLMILLIFEDHNYKRVENIKFFETSHLWSKMQ